jgi:hypothetical protein
MSLEDQRARYHQDGSEFGLAGTKGKSASIDSARMRETMRYPSKFPCLDKQAHRQFGNSVSVPIVERVARAVVARSVRPVDYGPGLVRAISDRRVLPPEGSRCLFQPAHVTRVKALKKV